MTDIAVVILNYNGTELLRKFLPSVIRHSAEAQVIVVDNGSTDTSIDVLRREFSAVQLISLPVNLGFCGGYNQALKKIDAAFYVLLNSDVEVTDGWLAPMRQLLDTEPTAAAVQPRILSHKARNSFEYAGAGGGFIDALGYPFCRGRLFYALEPDEGQYNDRCRIFWSSGACMMIRSTLFHQLGGFDEDFFAHMEEIDLCWRLQRAGHTIHYEGASAVFHLGGGTLSASNPRKTYLNFKNGLSLLYKNLPAGELLYKFPMRIALDWIASLKFALTGYFKDGQAVIRAHRHFIWNISRERARRRHTAAIGFRQPSTIYRGLIVWDFFIAGKRKFSRLRF